MNRTLFETRLNRPPVLLLCLFLLAMGLAVFLQTLQFEFLNLDDDYYVTNNKFIKLGFSPAGLEWAFTYTGTGNWHPLTWLSLMLDYQFYGLDPAGYHLTNVILHLLNALMIFLFLCKFTGTRWRAFFTAAFFLVHPLRAESVAWVTERKDVLSGLFFLTTIWAYGLYARADLMKKRSRHFWYAAALMSFLTGLLAKEMLVTLPFLLLLLDSWPLNRSGVPGSTQSWKSRAEKILLEKIPFLILIIPFCIMAILSRMQGALSINEKVPFLVRFLNSFAFYCEYLKRTFYPLGLSFHYPYPLQGIPALKILICAAIIVLVSLIVLREWKRYPYAATGWFWFLGTLVPVIGWLHIGESVHSDRYTYLPHIGLFIFVVWLAYDAVSKAIPRPGRWAIFAGAVILLAACSGFAFRQTSYWKDITTLNEYALRINPDNHMAHNNLGLALVLDKRNEEALVHFRKTQELRPWDGRPVFLIGAALHNLGRDEEALPYLMRVAAAPQKPKVMPNQQYIDAHSLLAEIFKDHGQAERAIQHYQVVLRYVPEDVTSLYNLANIYKDKGDYASAENYYRQTLRYNPSQHRAWNNLANLMNLSERYEDAEKIYKLILKDEPDNDRVAYNYVVLLVMTKRRDEAKIIFDQYLKAAPDSDFRRKAVKALETPEVS